jgi:hypothetical protein
LSFVSLFFADGFLFSKGGVFGATLCIYVGALNMRRNYSYLHSRAVPEIYRARAIEIISASPIVEYFFIVSGDFSNFLSFRSVHDVKAVVLQPHVYQLKAEIVVNGAALTDLVEKNHKREMQQLRRRFEGMPSDSHRYQVYNYHFSDLSQVSLGKETDEIEARIRKIMPEFRHIEIETV